MKRQRFIEIVRDLLEAAATYHQIEDLHRRGDLCFRHLEFLIDDRGHSTLYRLKENCHALFRNRNDPSCGDGEKLLDLAVGSIFHEAMKLRENLYQVDMYRPRYLAIRGQEGPSGKVLVERFKKIILRTEQGIRDGLADIQALFDDTLDQLLDLIRGYRDNDLLIRFLLSQERLFHRVYGRRQLEKLFASMFKGGLAQAYRVGAISYLESAYYDMASQLLAKARRLNPKDERLTFLHRYATGLEAYYNNDYPKALRSFGGLAQSNQTFKGKRACIHQAVAACREISIESLLERNTQRSLRARRLAHHLQSRHEGRRRKGLRGA